MLVLTRKPGQSVYIGDDTKVTQHEIRGNQVRLGIDAPSSVKIFREEIYQQILEENKSAVSELPVELGSDLGAVAKAWASNKTVALGKLSVSSRKRSSRSEEGEL